MRSFSIYSIVGRYLLTAILLFIFDGVYAGKEPELRSYKLCSDLSTGDTLLVYDQLFLNAAGTNILSPSGYHLFKTTNSVTLEVDQNSIIDCELSQFTVEVEVTLTRKDENGSNIGSPITTTLEVDYDKSLGVKYKEKHTLLFEGGFWYTAEIVSITSSNPSALGYTKLSIGTVIERYKDINKTTIPTFLAADFSSTNNEITFYWNSMSGAEEYDFEWVWYDDYSNTDVISNTIDASDIEYSFKNNAARVTVKGTNYTVSPTFERGYLLVRVRAVGYTGALFTYRVEGAWSSDNYGSKIHNLSGSSFVDGYDLIYIDNPWAAGDYKAHELTLNWQYSSSFAENGQRAEVVSYFDGTLHNRQTVTKNYSSEQAIVGETIFDFQGRAAISVLPVPAFENKLKFYPGFNLSRTTGLPYNRNDFDVDDGNCNNPLAQMDSTSGAARYYSAENPLVNDIQQEYIPMAYGFPFTLSEFMSDGTNRLKRQGGVGPNHQLGSGHETKYYYSRPNQEELDMLFGNSVGYKDHYQKNMIIDPNGQVSVAYHDLTGRIIATALAGNAPSNVHALPDNPSSTNLTVDIINNSDLEHENDAIISNMSFTVPMQADYTFNYSINIPRYNDSSKPAPCYDCVYDLEIQLLDECGQNILDGNLDVEGVQMFTRTLGKLTENFDTTCEETQLSYSFTNDGLLDDQIITINLPIGSYTLVKRLKINYSALEFYEQNFINNNASLKTETWYREHYLANIDYSGCGTTCDSCLIKLGSREDYIEKKSAELVSMDIVPTLEDTSAFDSQYDELLAFCNQLCSNSSIECDNMLRIIKMDISPGGQYATFDELSNEYNGILNIESDNGLGFNYIGFWYSSGSYDAPEGEIKYLDKNSNQIYVSIDGSLYRPNDLTPEQFVKYFEPSWANALSVNHPEYCKYKNCISDNSSNTYDNDMYNVNNWDEAVDSGFLNPLMDGSISFTQTRIDPFFATVGRGFSKKTIFKDLLNNYKSFNDGSACSLSIWTLVYATFVCDITSYSSCSKVNSCISSLDWNKCDPYKDKMWEMFRAIYIAEKQRMKDSIAQTNSCLGYTGMGPYENRFKTINEVEQNLSTDNNDKEIITNTTKTRMAVQCDSNCNSQANAWMKQFENCSMSSSARDTLRARLVRVCRNACDISHPFGASDIPNGRAITVGPSLRSFKEVFDDMVNNSLITAIPGICDINILNQWNYEHNEINHDENPADTNRCDSAWVNAPNCIKNDKDPQRKLAMAGNTPVHDSTVCEKCVDCDQFNDAVQYLFHEYNASGLEFFDTNYALRQVATNVINQYLHFNLNWFDYQDFARKCLELHDTIQTDTLLRLFKTDYVSYTILDLDEFEGKQKEFPPISYPKYTLESSDKSDQILLASNSEVMMIHTPSYRFISPCMCNTMALVANTHPDAGSFNDYFNDGCGASPPYDFFQIYLRCQEAWNSDDDNNILPLGSTSTWTQNQKTALENIGLEEDIEVPDCHFDDCPDDKEHPYQENSWYYPPVNSDIPRIGDGGTSTPQPERHIIPCDSFKMFLQQLKALPPFFIDLERICNDYQYKGQLLPVDTLALNTAMNLFYGVGSIPPGFQTFPNAYREKGFSGLEKFKAFLYMYMDCMSKNGIPSGSCCFNKTHYAVLLQKLLNGYAKPKGFLGNYFAYNGWSLTANNKFEYYNTSLYKNIVKSCSTGLAYKNRINRMPQLQFVMRDNCGDSSKIHLSFTKNLSNKMNFSKIIKFYGLVPVSSEACDTTHEFNILADILLKDGTILTTTLTGWAERYRMMDTCRLRDTLKLCDRSGIYTIPYKNNCRENLEILALFNAKKAYQEYLDSVRYDFRRKYIAKCMSGFQDETFEMGYSYLQYQYTLFYYDQSGNMIQTVPPAGVSINSGSTFLNNVRTARISNTSGYFPSHSMVNRYKYNSLDQLISQSTVEGGESQYWYDRLGRPVISQNAKQFNTTPKSYSYTIYDALGRIKEVGQFQCSTAMTGTIALDMENIESYINSPSKTEITRTLYDDNSETFPSYTQFSPNNLRSRVSGILYFPTLPSGANASGTYSQAIYYSYDIHGNVKMILREIPDLEYIDQNYKTVRYDYDLIGGNVKEIIYQYGQMDMFAHRYNYDADNKLKETFTSHNLVHWDKDSKIQYYLHGPKARIELGELKVQGIDYAYTIHGWIKGVNSTTLKSDRDIGHDGDVGSVNQYVAKDVFGYSLGYYENDFQAIGSRRSSSPLANNQLFTPLTTTSSLGRASSDLWNGNIRHMVTAIEPFMNVYGMPLARAYQYDQLNRITDAFTYDQVEIDSNLWKYSGSANSDYEEHFSYDPNGNITTLTRNGTTAGSNPLDMDDFTYHYVSGTNKLNYVDDSKSMSNYDNDIDDQSSNNYEYDEVGNLVSDDAEEIESIEWTLSGKIKSITRTVGSLRDNLEFEYSPDGHRVSKKITSPNGNISTTYYFRDTRGNILSTYTHKMDTLDADTFIWSEAHIYGLQRIGIYNANKVLVANRSPESNPLEDNEYSNIRGKRNYELYNHLGNVMAVITDRRSGFCEDEEITYYKAEVIDATDYYAFGSPMPGRQGIVRCQTDTTQDTAVVYIKNEDFETTTGGFSVTGPRTLSRPTGHYLHIEAAWTNKPIATTTVNLVNGRTYTLNVDIVGFSVVGGFTHTVRIRVLLPSGGTVTNTYTTTGTKTFSFTSNTTGSVTIEIASVINPPTGSYGSGFPYIDIDNFKVSWDSTYSTLVTTCAVDPQSYRFAFNGREIDRVPQGAGSTYDYGFRIYNPSLGRFFTVDPMAKSYPELSTYQFSSNTPIQASDLDGLEKIYYKMTIDEDGNTTITYDRSEDIVERVWVWETYTWLGFTITVPVTKDIVNARQEYYVEYTFNDALVIGYAAHYGPVTLTKRFYSENAALNTNVDEWDAEFAKHDFAKGMLGGFASRLGSRFCVSRVARNMAKSYSKSINKKSSTKSGASKNAAGYKGLKENLSKQAKTSPFNDDGTIKEEVIAGSTPIIRGAKINNPALVKMLTEDGSSINDWAKMSYVAKTGDGKSIDVHYYYNSKTGKVFYDLDYKVIFSNNYYNQGSTGPGVNQQGVNPSGTR